MGKSFLPSICIHLLSYLEMSEVLKLFLSVRKQMSANKSYFDSFHTQINPRKVKSLQGKKKVTYS